MFKKYSALVKKVKPVTPGQRNKKVLVNSEITYRGRPFKSLTENIKRGYGINNLGRRTNRNKLSPKNKRLYRVIDFIRLRLDKLATVIRIEIDPNRSANIALIRYDDGVYSYILHLSGLMVGDKIMSSNNKLLIEVGNCMPIVYIPVETKISNIPLQFNGKAIMARSAGTYAVIVSKEEKFTIIKLMSGELRKVHNNIRVTVGVVSNIGWFERRSGKAGANYNYGRKMHVRGSAMSVNAHPLGGGEGRQGEGRIPCDRHGNVDHVTRKSRKPYNKLIVLSARKSRINKRR